MKNFGYLSVMVLNAGGALPVPDALVKIESADEYDRVEPQSATTDIDGKTEIFALPSPSSSYSLTPSPAGNPSSLYKVSVYKDGFYARVLDNVPIFENIYSTLTVSIVPNSLYNKQENEPILPGETEKGGNRI